MKNITTFQDLRYITLESGQKAYIIRIIGDGNCLFRAIAERCKYLETDLSQGFQDHESLRIAVVEELKKDCYKDTIKATLSDEKKRDIEEITEQDVVKYLFERINKPGVYAGTPEIIAISMLLKKRIIIYEDHSIKKIPSGKDYNDWEEAIEIIHENINADLQSSSQEKNHYNLIAREDLLSRILPDMYLTKSLQQTQLDKNEDLENLKKIAILIDDFSNIKFFQGQEKDIFSNIGLFASKIKYNDSGDRKKEYIRNRYGSIDRSNSAQRRAGGLELVHLAALQNLKENFDDITLQKLKKDLTDIRDKIHLVIRTEETPSPESIDSTLSIFRENNKKNDFTNFVSYFYSKRVLKELIIRLDDDKIIDLDFSKRSDRYYFGRILSVIGELIKEYKDFTNYGEESGIFTALKNIRDQKMAHSYSVMVKDLKANQITGFKTFSAFLTRDFKTALTDMLSYMEESIGNIAAPMAFESAEKKKIKKFMSVLFDDLAEDIDSLDDIKVKYYKKKVNDLSQKSMSEKKTSKKVKYARDFSIKDANDALEKIIRKSKKVDELRLAKKKKDKNKIKADQIKVEILSLIKKYDDLVDDEFKINGDRTLEKLIEIHEILKNSDSSYAVKFEQKENPKTEIIEANNPNPKPHIEQQKDIKKNIELRLGIISAELEFIMNVIKSDNIEETKKNAIIEFSYSKLGQIFKDIEKKEKLLLLQYAPEVFQKSIEKTESTRHKLMHDILSLDMLDFNKVLFRETLPIIPEINAIRKVLQTIDKTTNDTSNLMKLGIAYIKLQKYDESMECFLAVVKLCNAKIILTEDEDEIHKNITSILDAYSYMSHNCGKHALKESDAGNLEKSQELYEAKLSYLESNLRFILAIDIVYPGNHDIQLASLYNNIANVYSYLSNYKQSVEYTKLALKFLKKKNPDYFVKKGIYVSNLGRSYQKTYDKLPEKLDDEEYVFKFRLDTNKVAACLFEAKLCFEQAGVNNSDKTYVRVTKDLIAMLFTSGSYINSIYAEMLYEELVITLKNFPAREDELIDVNYLKTLHEHRLNHTDKAREDLLLKLKNNKESFYLDFQLGMSEKLKELYNELGIQDRELDKRLDDLRSKNACADEIEFVNNVIEPNNTGKFSCDKGEINKALGKFLLALRNVKNSKYKKHYPRILPMLYDNLGISYSKLDKHSEAIRYFQKALDAYIKYDLVHKDRSFKIFGDLARSNAFLYQRESTRNQAINHENLHKMLIRYLELFKNRVDKNDTRLKEMNKMLCMLDNSTNFAPGISNYSAETSLVQNVKSDTIEKRILSSYNKLIQQKPKSRSAETLIVVFKGTFNFKDVKDYVKSKLNLGSDSLTYEDGKFYLYLSQQNQKALNNLDTNNNVEKQTVKF